MSIRIKRISLKNCGPLSNCIFELEDINLIYSENERGKSYLVEFIIHSLFKNKKYWKKLRPPGNGKIFVSGLDVKLTEFTPSTKRKLEDYLEKNQGGLSPAICNLLTVKEGETEIVKSEYGLDKNTLKEILLPTKLLNELDDDRNISLTIKRARIENGEIIIERRGEGKDYIELVEKLRGIEEVLSQIVNEYEQGEIRDLQIEREELLEEKQILLKAKRYQAFVLSEELKRLRKRSEKINDQIIKKLKNLINEHKELKNILKEINTDLNAIRNQTERIPELEYKKEQLLKAKRHEAYKISLGLIELGEKLKNLSEEDIASIHQSINQYRDKFSEIEEKSRILEQIKENSKDYHWLKSARDYYQKFLSSDLKLKNRISMLLYLSLISIFLGILFIILEQNTLGFAFFIISTFCALLYSFKLKRFFPNFKENEELKQIERDFLNRFGKELRSLTQLEEILLAQERYFFNIETYERECLRLNTELANLEKKIQETFCRLGLTNISREDWEERFHELKRIHESLKEEYRILREKLLELDVKEEDYEINPPKVKFSSDELDRVREELAGLKKLKEEEFKKEQERNEKEKRLTEIEHEISALFVKITDKKLNESEWETEIEGLEIEKQEIERDIKKIEGQLEGLGVSESEFEMTDPKRKFTHQELERIEKRLNLVEDKLKQEENKHLKLRQRIIQLTGADFSLSWNELLERLYIVRNELYENLQQVQAKIIAGILLHETLQELQREEDEKLLEKLNSPEITGLIRRTTGRYKNLSFYSSRKYHEGEKDFDERDIIIEDDYSSFRLRDLSTGAKEQVMIALRIAFAKEILKRQSAFLILDDAFQHSDYKKRPVLIDTLFELANEGWQIIYLTMDEHIRNLFKEIGKASPLSFKEINLHS